MHIPKSKYAYTMFFLFLNLCMETLIMHPQSKEQLNALKAIAKAWKISVETSSYNPDFVAKIKQSKKEVDKGKFTTLDPAKSVWENLR